MSSNIVPCTNSKLSVEQKYDDVRILPENSAPFSSDKDTPDDVHETECSYHDKIVVNFKIQEIIKIRGVFPFQRKKTTEEFKYQVEVIHSPLICNLCHYEVIVKTDMEDAWEPVSRKRMKSAYARSIATEIKSHILTYKLATII